MKVLLIGNGGREHAIAERLSKSPKCASIICFAGKTNPGIKDLCSAYEVGNLLDFEHLGRFVKKEHPHLAILGPDDPIALGAADILEGLGIPTVGPKKMLARLESSKSFTRELLRAHNIEASPKFKVVSDLNDAKDFIEHEIQGEFVVKADGLCGGKGVKVQGDHFDTIDEGLKYAKDCIEGQERVIIEEKLIGEEFSLMSFVDGKTVIDMPGIQDFKRAYEHDKGPNTGGMGSFSFPEKLPFITKKDLEDAHKITVKTMGALEKECGESYKGIMYGGFIATPNGVRLIEYNARFGDPEAMNVLPILKTDFMDICLGIINNSLDQVDIKFAPKATVCKYTAPAGYPEDVHAAGKKIELKHIPTGVHTYYGSIDKKEDGLYLSTSRAIAFTGIADTIDEAEKLVEAAIQNVEGPIFHRSDIGKPEMIEEKIRRMKKLRKEEF